MATAKVLVTIDLRLRFLFFGLECVLGRPLYPAAVERVFSDAAAGSCAAAEYVFLAERRCRMTGVVEEYEPETIWVCVDGPRALRARLADLSALADDYATRARRNVGRSGGALC